MCQNITSVLAETQFGSEVEVHMILVLGKYISKSKKILKKIYMCIFIMYMHFCQVS
jgi:hypothetical protein